MIKTLDGILHQIKEKNTRIWMLPSVDPIGKMRIKTTPHKSL